MSVWVDWDGSIGEWTCVGWDRLVFVVCAVEDGGVKSAVSFLGVYQKTSADELTLLLRSCIGPVGCSWFGPVAKTS